MHVDPILRIETEKNTVVLSNKNIPNPGYRCEKSI
jgi:hypothetical protein